MADVDWRPLAAFIQSHISSDPQRKLEEDTPLLSSGLVESMALVELVVHLEKTYAVRIPATRMTVEDFETVAQIVKLVRSLQPGR